MEYYGIPRAKLSRFRTKYCNEFPNTGTGTRFLQDTDMCIGIGMGMGMNIGMGMGIGMDMDMSRI